MIHGVPTNQLTEMGEETEYDGLDERDVPSAAKETGLTAGNRKMRIANHAGLPVSIITSIPALREQILESEDPRMIGACLCRIRELKAGTTQSRIEENNRAYAEHVAHTDLSHVEIDLGPRKGELVSTLVSRKYLDRLLTTTTDVKVKAACHVRIIKLEREKAFAALEASYREAVGNQAGQPPTRTKILKTAKTWGRPSQAM